MNVNVHRHDDGRGLRRVLLNGREIKRVFYADTRKGVVRQHRDPIQIHKHGKRTVVKTTHGKVEVEFI